MVFVSFLDDSWADAISCDMNSSSCNSLDNLFAGY